MSVILDERKTPYFLYEFQTESEFEKKIVSLAEEIFGNTSIYFDVKKKIKKMRSLIIQTATY